MRLRRKPPSKTDQVRDLALSALSTALEDGKRTVRSTSKLSGTRAVAAGAALYTAGHAVVSGGRFIRNKVAAGEPPEEEQYEEEPPRRRRRASAGR
jgi:hypothetical protein